MRFLQAAGRVAVPISVGTAIAILSLVGTTRPAPSAARASCYSGLRLLRHAVAAYWSQHDHLPGWLGTTPASDAGVSASLLVRQLTQPRDASGAPSAQGPYPGLIDAIPVNPFTTSRTIVVVPAGEDPIAFAAASRAGWAYLAADSRDAAGPLPAGLVVPCGGDRGAGGASVQSLAFEIEDFQQWR